MNYQILGQLNGVLKNLQSDAATVGLTIAGLMIVVSAIWIMLDNTSNVGVHKDRWEQLRKVFVCAALIAAAGALVSFGQLLGGALHA